MKKLLTAMSGGVDSAVCCALLQQAGFEVGGGTMLLRPGGEAEAEDARSVCEQLGVPFHLFSWQDAFRSTVEDDFCRQYCAGRTPNPCVLCNKAMKFGRFLDEALALGCDGMATGHYARIEQSDGRYYLRIAADAAKDQTYMLYSLSQAQLSRSVFPLGDYTKARVREIAAELGLHLAAKHDSQDVCFIPDGDYCAYLVRRGVSLTPGRFRTMDGADLGPHRGAECYTIGQRRGLGLSAGERVYVLAKPWPDVTIGPNDALFSRRVTVENVNYIAVDRLDAPRRVRAKLRYTPRVAQALLIPSETGAELLFDEPQRAVTPGQSAVFYEDDYVLGGGIIAGAEKD